FGIRGYRINVCNHLYFQHIQKMPGVGVVMLTSFQPWSDSILHLCRSGRDRAELPTRRRKIRTPMKAHIDLDVGHKTFASGLLPELLAALGRCRPGDLVAVMGSDESIGPELETWCRFTGNSLLEATVEHGRPRWVFRCGTIAAPAEDNRPVGSRLWL